MGITPQFSMDDIRRKLNADMAKINLLIYNRLVYLGEMCVNHARTVPAQIGYHDRTGALRASTGYAIFSNGKQVHGNFNGSEAVTNGDSAAMEAGKAAAQSLANEVAQANPIGWVLVVVAGMEYAVYVEATGRDVLTTAEQLAQEALPGMMRSLVKQIAKI